MHFNFNLKSSYSWWWNYEDLGLVSFFRLGLHTTAGKTRERSRSPKLCRHRTQPPWTEDKIKIEIKGKQHCQMGMERWGETAQMSFRLSLSPVHPPGEPWVWRPGSDQVWHLSAPRCFHRCGVPLSAPRCRTRACPPSRNWGIDVVVVVVVMMGEKHKANLLLMLRDNFFSIQSRGQNRKLEHLDK